MMTRIVLCWAAVALAACQPAPAPSTDSETAGVSEEMPVGEPCPAGTFATDTPVTYTCTGATFTVRYEPETSCANVDAGGQTYRLPSSMAASGERYYDGTHLYWAHNGEAMLEGVAGGPYENCRQADTEQ